MKKTVAAVLAVLFIVSNMIFPVYAADSDYKDIAVKVEILQQLGIVENDIDLDEAVTRAKFAEYIGRMLNVNSNYAKKRYFTDVAENSVINTLTDMGVFNGTAESLFEPDNKIELEHACVALTKALGYHLGTNGADIGAYISLANRLDITDGVSLGLDATNANILLMVYNTLMAVAGEPDVYLRSGDSWEYSMNSTGKTLIEIVFDAYVTEGCVTENCYTGLYDTSTIAKNRIKIDSTEYKCKIDGAENLIGQNVTALISFKDGESSMHSIVYITADDEKNEMLTIDAEQIDSYDNNVLKYYNEKGKLKTVRFSPSMALIYNGVAIGSDYKNYFGFDIGTLKCIKSDGNFYNVAVIEHIKNVKVKAVDLSEHVIYADGAAPYNMFDMSEEADSYKKIYIAGSDKALGVESLSNGDLLSVIRSSDGNYIKAFLCTETVEGVLSSISSGSDAIYTINGVEYEAAAGYNPLEKYNIGDKIGCIIDITGRIAADEKLTVQDDKILGYVYEMQEDERSKNQIRFKIYTQYKEVVTVDCADKIKLDGESVKESDIPAKFKKFDGSFNRSIILFKLNSKGEICYIDTPAESKLKKEKTDSLWKMAEEGTYTFDDSANIFRPCYPTRNQTYIFCIPFEENEDPTELSFGVYTFDGDIPFTRFIEYDNVGLYKFSEDTPYVDVVTLRRSESLNGSIGIYADVLLVDNITSVSGEDGENIQKIYGLSRNTTVEYRVEPGLDISSLGSGDIIKFERNARGYISTFDPIYDYSSNLPKWGTAYESAAFNSGERYTMGYLDSIYINNIGNDYTAKSLFNVSDILGGDVVESHSWHTNNNTFMIYDGSRRNNKAYLGSINDLLTYENAQNTASRLFVQWRYQNRISWIFYK